MKIVFATSLDNEYVIKAYTFLEQLIGNENVIYIRNPINKGIPDKYDIGLSFLYVNKVPKLELNTPWINWHPGPLPKYKGRNVIYRAMMEDAETFGGTIHYMDENFDTGDIIEVEKFTLYDTYTAGDVLDKTYQVLLGLFYKYVPQIIEGRELPRTKQHQGYAYKKVEINDFVDLSLEQKNKIRALTVHPKYHAKVKIANKTYKIIPE